MPPPQTFRLIQSDSELVAGSRQRAPSLQALRDFASSVASEQPDETRLAFAHSFISRVVATWWVALVKRLAVRRLIPLRPHFEEVEFSILVPLVDSAAVGIAAELEKLTSEEAGFEIGQLYASLLSNNQRGRFGIYYTPSELVERLLDQATDAGVDWRTCRVLDPSCGAGAFLLVAARRMLDALGHCDERFIVENISSRLCGFEVDSFAAWLSQVAVDAILLPMAMRVRSDLPKIVEVRDSLKDTEPSRRFDLVMGNPPYGRVVLDDDVRSAFARSLYGHANLYGLFTDLALRYTERKTGVISYVTPTSFLAGEYFKKLRSLIGQETRPTAIDFVTARKGVFEGVLQETVLVTYRRQSKRKTVKVSEIIYRAGSNTRVKGVGAVSLPKNWSGPWLLPRNATEKHLVAKLLQMPHRLSDWGYSVSTGPLVWNRYKDQLVNEDGPDSYPIVWAEAVSSDGRFAWRTDKRNHAPYLRYRSGDEWLLSRTPCVLLQRTTAKEQPRRLIAAEMPDELLRLHGAVVIENHLNMIRATCPAPSVTPSVVAALLNSRILDRVFRCVSGSVAVSAYEIESLPLPSPERLDELMAVVDAGAKWERIEAACVRLYEDAF